MVLTLRRRATASARNTLGELPLVVNTSSTSPGCPKASTCRAKISSNAKSLPRQVNNAPSAEKCNGGQSRTICLVMSRPVPPRDAAPHSHCRHCRRSESGHRCGGLFAGLPQPSRRPRQSGFRLFKYLLRGLQ
jgi:hypothetical protein